MAVGGEVLLYACQLISRFISDQPFCARDSDMDSISASNLESHLSHLTKTIGIRLAGTDGERLAADYLCEQGERMGVQASVETFPVNARAVESECLKVQTGAGNEAFKCSLFSNSPGTNGREIRGEIAVFEAPAATLHDDYSRFTGKAVIHLGCHIESRESYRRLIEAKPAFLMFVDVRYPGPDPRADGLFPAYVESIGAVPVVNVAFADALSWIRDGATWASLIVDGGMVPGESQNVVFDLPGSSDDILLLGAHHDTQADTVGANDNASGVVSLLELLRVLVPLERRRSIRLISFGAEEQLSVGSAVYVRRHRQALEGRAKLIFNIDSIGAIMGWNELITNGPAELEEYMLGQFHARSQFAKVLPSIMPYADHFPFVAAGIPGVTFWRFNCSSGISTHHHPTDRMDMISTRNMAKYLDIVATMMADLSQRETLPFKSSIPVEQAHAVESYWSDLFGGWLVSRGVVRNRVF